MGHHAAVLVESRARRHLSDSVSESHGFRVRLYCRRSDLHVRVRCAEVVFAVPLRFRQVSAVRRRCSVHDSGEHRHRECGRGLGFVRQEAQVLCRSERCAENDNCLNDDGTPLKDRAHLIYTDLQKGTRRLNVETHAIAGPTGGSFFCFLRREHS